MKLLFLFMFSAIPFLSSAQGKIRYSYDWSGNRIERVIVMPKAKSNAAARHDSFTDDFGDRKVQIIPNYSQGTLRVSITKLHGDDCCDLAVYSSTGELVAQKMNAGSATEFNLNGRPNGVYLLQVVFNGESSTWKIVKQ